MEAGVLFYDFERFIPAEILSLIETYRITTLCCPPAVYGSLLGEDMEKYDLSSLAHATAAGEALSPAVFREWKRRTGLSLMEGFGQAEPALLIEPQVTVPKPGSIGKPAPCYAVDLIDEEGQSCPPGVAGEIALAADPKPLGLMDGYYGEEERTAKAFREGWYRTGDAAWRDEDGFFFYLGRNDDIIRSSGYRISPFEIESVLRSIGVSGMCVTVFRRKSGHAGKGNRRPAEGYSPRKRSKCELQNM
jgi:acetyl-CoA synthetase